MRTDLSGAVATVTIDRPPYNYVDSRLATDLHGAIRGLTRNQSVRVIVIKSAVHGTFIGHADVPEVLAQLAATPRRLGRRAAAATMRVAAVAARLPRLRKLLRAGRAAPLLHLLRLHAIVLELLYCDKTTIAAIEGNALGPGCDLALACDLRVMATGAHRIGCPELTIGTIPGIGGSHRLAQILGPARAFELLLSGRTLSAAEAGRLGLVTTVCAPDALDRHIGDLAAMAATRPPGAIRALKRALNDGASLTTRTALVRERALFLAAVSADEVNRAMRTYAVRQDRLDGAPPWGDARELGRLQRGIAFAEPELRDDRESGATRTARVS